MSQMKVRFLTSVSSSRLSEHGYTKEEEKEIFNQVLQDVYDNPRWYLDNLDYITTFQVFWASSKPRTVVIPYEHTYIEEKRREETKDL